MGWVVEVESDDGAVLYAVHVEDALAAEELVKNFLQIKSEVSVRVISQIGDEVLSHLKVDIGAVKGPM